MKPVFIASLLVACLTACGSSVKLDTAPVEDKSGTLVGKGGDAGGAGSAAGGAKAGSGAGAGAGAGAATAAGVPDAVAKSAVAQVDTTKKPAGPDLLTSPKVIYFDYDSIAIKPEFQAVVETHARLLRADKTRRVALEGHTDERGGREYNLALGQKRAEAVRNAMSLLGVPDSQVETVSLGMEKPAAQGKDEASYAKNRRVEVNYR